MFIMDEFSRAVLYLQEISAGPEEFPRMACELQMIPYHCVNYPRICSAAALSDYPAVVRAARRFTLRRTRSFRLTQIVIFVSRSDTNSRACQTSSV